MELNVWSLGGIALIAAATFSVGLWGARSARTTSDFLVARRLVNAERNAAAISGEYLSAASFLGVAGLVLKDGADALWYPIGFAAGYLALLLYVAAPLRRSGAYTLPDFAEARLDSLPLRRLTTAFVVLIGWFYLLPQLQAAGATLTTVTGLPYWTGVVGVAVIVLVCVLSGGMRAITLVQAFQYWVKLTAITVPAFVLVFVFIVADAHHGTNRLDQPPPPTFQHNTTVHITTSVRLRVRQAVWLEVSGNPARTSASENPARTGTLENGTVYLSPDVYSVPAGTDLRFPAGAAVPVVTDAAPDNETWLTPQHGGALSLFRTYSLILATFLGTMGLPHVLVRFYTNPSGIAARRTTLFVVAMLSAFYLFPTIFGMLSRFYVPQLLVTGDTDAAVLLLPGAALHNWVGGVLAAIIAAGAFAAFLSTSSGLLVSITGVLSTDLLPGQVRDFRFISVAAVTVPTLLALVLAPENVSQSVALAFALAASTFCPLLVLGIWWRGLTAAGAAAGLVVGGGLVLLAVLVGGLAGSSSGWVAAVTTQPAAITVPAAFLVTYVVSRATKARRPADVARVMLRMHAPDRLGFIQDRVLERFGSGVVGAAPPDRAEEAGTGGRHRG